MTKNYVDVKVTLWNRAYFDDEADMNKVSALLRENKLDEIYDDQLGFLECETLYDTEEVQYDGEFKLPIFEVYQNEEIIDENT